MPMDEMGEIGWRLAQPLVVRQQWKTLLGVKVAELATRRFCRY
jgi:hypothetical protein